MVLSGDLRMKNLLIAFVFCLCGTCLYADSSRTYIEMYNYGYDEPNLMTKDSSIAFFSLGFQDYGTIDTDSIIGNVRYFIGETDYWSTSTGTTSNDPTYGFSGELAYKRTISNYGIFLGLGYRQLYDDWAPKQSSTGHWAYDRKSEYLYLPLGIINYFGESGYFKSQLNYLIEGTQTSYLGYLGGSYLDTINDQSSGYGLDLEYSSGNAYSIFIRYWNIDDSTINNGLYEPNNTTTEIGFKYLF